MKTLVASLLLIASFGAYAQAAATITATVPGKWSVKQGFIVTAPDGSRFACELGSYDPDKMISATQVALDCSTFEGELSKVGDADGVLRDAE